MAMLLLAIVFLLYNSVEFFAFLPGFIRKMMFFSFIFVLGFVVIYHIVLPLIKLLRYQKEMSLQEAARIIGNHFPEQVNDSLLNTLQLHNELENSGGREEALLIEAIKQRTRQLSGVPFVKAVDTASTFRFLKAFIAVSIVFITVFAFYPSFFKQPVKRIIAYEADFQKPFPFEVLFENTALEVLQNDDFVFKLNVKGEEIPAEFYIEMDGTSYLMEKIDVTDRRFVFRKVSERIDFRVKAGDYKSQQLELIVRPKPLLLSYNAHISFPSYMKRKEESLKDFTFASLPVGTRLEWELFTRNTDSILIKKDSVQEMVVVENGIAKWSQYLLQNQVVSYVPRNSFRSKNEEIDIRLEVIDDEYPTIVVDKLNNEAYSKSYFFTGTITDDYGFTALKAFASNRTENDGAGLSVKMPLSIEKETQRQQFYFSLNMDSLKLAENGKIEVYFEVFDNDAVSGPKKTKSSSFILESVTKSLLDSVSAMKEDELTNRMEQALKETADLKKEMATFNKSLMMKKEPDWSDQQKLKQLLERQKNLESEITDIKEQRKDLNDFNKNNEIQNEKLLEKQARIDALMEEVIPEDIKKMMDELQALLDEFNKDKVNELMKKMEMSQQEMEKMLDRNLSLLDQLKFEKEMTQLANKLKELSEKLKKNAEETTNSHDSKDDLLNNLEGLKRDFENQISILDTLERKNKDLESPLHMEQTSEEEDEIRKEMEEGSQQLQKGKKKDSGRKQKEAADKMDQLSQRLMAMMEQSQEDQAEEDATALRFLLENLLRISMSQESILNKSKQIKRDDPTFVDLIKEQGGIAESFRVVEDSLLALSKRQPMIENFVFGEVSNVKMRIVEAQSAMKDRNTGTALSAQQYSMMGMNNLALMLAESLKNMQESMGMPSPAQGKGKGKGKQKNKQPGDALQNMREMQEALGKQLKEAMKGNQGKGKHGGMSEELARMAAQQEALRGQLKQMLDGMKSEGQTGDNGLNKVLEQMEKFEEGLVNKRMNQQMLNLQNDIVVRLLESEKAQKERDQEERRESEEFKGKNSGNLDAIPEYKRLIENQQDQLKVQPIDLTPFYKKLVNEYFIRSNEKK